MPRDGAGGRQVNLKPFKRGMHLLLLCLLLGGSWHLNSSLFADTLYEEGSHGLSADLKMVRTLIRADVLDLAESILENQSPSILPTDEWLAWERQLWSLYAHRGKWQELYERAVQVPPSFPESIRNEALDQVVIALLEQARGAEARRIAVKRMISTQLSAGDIREIRKLVIRSYLVDGLLSDAAISMVNYQREFRYPDEEWLFLRAGVFLKLGQPGEAVNLLAPANSPRARLLALYARLVHQSMTPSQGAERLDAILSRDEDGNLGSGLTEVEVAAIEAYLSRLTGRHEYITKLEQYLIAKDEFGVSVEGAFPVFDMSDLFREYENYAVHLIGDHGLLENDLPGILNHVLSLPITGTLQQRALTAYLLSRIHVPLQRRQLCDLFVTSLLNSGSIELMPSLFAPDAPLGELSLGGEVGLVLSNAMIDQGRVQLAAQVIDSMAETPTISIEPERWKLHKARVSVVAGRFLISYQQLRQLINSKSELSPEQMDEILTPIFDLQKFRQHEYALKLLGLLRTKAITRQQDRELTYWIGETLQATHQYVNAANYFLYSAVLEKDGYDPWGISARYYAAQSLESAHLYADAKKLYESLLDHMTDEARRAELHQKIRELALWESGSFNVGESLTEGAN